MPETKLLVFKSKLKCCKCGRRADNLDKKSNKFNPNSIKFSKMVNLTLFLFNYF